MITVNGHILTNGNISGDQLTTALSSNYPNGVDWCYTDPPWGNGNLKYWATINKKMTNTSINQIDQYTLEDRVVDIFTTYVRNYTFVVYGVKEAESLMAKARSKGNVRDVQYIEKKYNAGSKWLKNCIICITLNDAPVVDWVPVFSGQHGINGLKSICKMFSGRSSSCLDMFIGVGHYLNVLDSYGFKVIGNELNRARLSKAIAKINKKA